MFALAASAAVEQAGMDGVELHMANGYLLDTFLQNASNQRIDDYGGSVENRSRFPLEVIEAVINAIGQRKTAVRFSPWSPFQGLFFNELTRLFIYLPEQNRQVWECIVWTSSINSRTLSLRYGTNTLTLHIF